MTSFKVGDNVAFAVAGKQTTGTIHALPGEGKVVLKTKTGALLTRKLTSVKSV